MPMIAFECGAQYIKRSDFKSDAAKPVFAKVISSVKGPAQAAGRAAGRVVPAGAQRALSPVAQAAAHSAPGVAAQATQHMRPFARVLGGMAIGSTLGGIGGAYRGYTHDRREPFLGAVTQGLAGALGGGLLGGLTGSVVNPAFRV